MSRIKNNLSACGNDTVHSTAMSSLFCRSIDTKMSSITAEAVSCSVTSMDFFDRLQEQGLKVLISQQVLLNK